MDANVTESETFLARLCAKSFLRLWSYARVYRDAEHRGDGIIGKELCDLLVVFGPHVIVFSDKQCAFPDTGNLRQDWRRWFRRAISKSADQAWGAERWIRRNPDRLFTDPRCGHRLPIPLPPPAEMVVHRIVVAHGSASRCRATFGGGSGSLLIVPGIVGDEHFSDTTSLTPFAVGFLSDSRGFVHVLDDFTLEVLLATLDTAADFTQYLDRKEQFLRSGALVFAAGEEDLLAYYLRHVDDTGHTFPHRRNEYVMIDEGAWESFQQHPDRVAQVEADRISYAWDNLIETFTTHLLDGTQYFASVAPFPDTELGLRIMAAESRTRRRALAKALIRHVENGVRNDRAARLIVPGSSDTYYVFLTLKKPTNRSYDSYRRVRAEFLRCHCMVARQMHTRARHVIGIATEPGLHAGSRSEDVVYLDGSQWTPQLDAEARKLQRDLGIFTTRVASAFRELEYPRSRDAEFRKGRSRNLPCPCGSGRKYKKCCGRHE